MKRILILHLFMICLISQAVGQVYNRPLSEAQTFYIPSDAVNNDVAGTILAYPEFHNIGSAPTFVLKSNVDNIYAVSSSGVITISDKTSLGTGDDVITVTISKSGYADYDINVTITCISVSSNTIFIDPSSPTNGVGTRANPKNVIPDLNTNNGYKYWFKRGTTLTLASQMAAMGYQTNKYFCSFGQGAKAKIVGNNIRIFAAGDGCSNLRFSELEITAASPSIDGSNWLSQPLYFGNTAGSIEVSHCSVSYGMTGFGTGASIALPGLLLAFNKIHHTRQDGCYIGNVTVYTTVIGNDVSGVNWAYQFDGTSETVAGGDCVQFGSCDAIIARGNYLDHSQFGNKFCIIAGDFSNNRYSAQITDNYCLAPPNNTAIYVEGYKTGTKVSRNYTQGGAQGMSYGGGGGVIQFDYNIIKSPSSVGIYGGTSNIYNNTFYGCPTAISSHAAGYPAKNNLFYFTSSSQIAYNNSGNVAYDYNLFSDEHANMFGSGRNTVSGQTGEDNSIVGNPSFISSSDIHLNSNSPCINAGVEESLLVDKDKVSISGRPDIGAYEFNSNSPPPVIPVYQNAVIENVSPSVLVMTYNTNLANIVSATSAFTVIVNSAARTVSSVSVSGTKVSLTLSSSVVYGDNVTITYNKPATNPLQSASGGQAVSISLKTVLNNVAGLIPTYVNSSIENVSPSVLVMTYNTNLANIVSATSAFTVMVNSAARTVSSVSVSGTKVSLTLSSPVVYGDNVTITYNKPATNPLQSASGGQAASISLKTVLNNVAGLIPIYVNSSIENVSPSVLVMTYNTNLANIVSATSAFTVMVNSAARTVSSVSVSGTKVSLTLSSPVVYGDNVTITYNKPATNPLQSASGGQAASISLKTVLNNVAGLIPTYVNSSIENATPASIEMNYNQSLANIVPATSAFTVMVNSAARSVSSVSVSGTKVSLTLSNPVVYGDNVTITYNKPATNPLQSASGGQAASISLQTVLNNVAGLIPTYVNSSIENATPASIEMNYNQSLANIVPATSAFTVMVNSAARSVSSVSVSGTKVSLTLSNPVVYGDNVTITYNKPATNPLQSASGGQAASISLQTVLNNVAGLIPTYVNSSIENVSPSVLVMTYNTNLANIVSATSAFTVMVNSAARTVSSVSVSGTKVSLTLSSPVVYGDNVTITYNKPATNPLQSASGGQAASISLKTVLNNVAGLIPTYVNSSIENATPASIDMNYNQSLANIVPATSAFTVMVNSAARTVSSVSVSGTKVSLTLSSPVVYGDNVTITYNKPATNPLQSASGGQAASISLKTVLNNVAGLIPTYVNSSIENATPASIEMNYNQSLANIVPAASAFTVLINSVVRTVSTVTVSGTRVFLSLASPVVYGNVVTVTYTRPSTNPLQTTTGAQVLTFGNQTVVNNCVDIPPVTSITSPLNNSTFPYASDITITANATDADGSISDLEYYNGSTKIGASTTAPYSFTWNNVPEGTYSLTVIATDNMNAKTKSAAISISVGNQPPVIKITYPKKGGGRFKRNSTITFSAVATDPDGTISSVSFFNGSVMLARLTSAPYEYTWKEVGTGRYSVTAVATDNLNASSSSDPIDFIVENNVVYDANSEIINLYPNPSDGHFSIEFIKPILSEKSTIVINDLAGKQVYSTTISKEDMIKQFDFSDQLPGYYIMMIKDKDILVTKKFIIR